MAVPWQFLSSCASLCFLVGIFGLLYLLSQRRVDPSFLFDEIQTKGIEQYEMQESIASFRRYIELIDRLKSQSKSEKLKRLKAWAFVGYFHSTIEGFERQRNISRIQEIIASFDQAIKIYETSFQNSDVEGDLMYFVYMQQSRQLGILGHSVKALNSVDKATFLSSNGVEEAAAFALHGDILLSIGDIDQALQKFQAALTIKPYDLSIYDKVVDCHKHLNSFSKNKWRGFYQELVTLTLKYREQPLLLQEQSKLMEQNRSEGRMGYVDATDIFTDRRYKQANNTYITAKMAMNHTELIYGEHGVHNALFEAAEMAGMYNEAWAHALYRKNITMERDKREEGFVLVTNPTSFSPAFSSSSF